MLTKWVQAVFCRQVRCMSVLGGVKQPKANCFVVQLNFSFPFVIFFTYTCITSFVVTTFSVLRIFSICCLSKIAQPIIRAIFINVVKLIRRPVTINVQPCQPMCGVQNVVYTNTNVTIVHLASSSRTMATTPPWLVPCKNACVNVIIDQFAKSSLRNIFSFHGFNYIKQAGYCQA